SFSKDTLTIYPALSLLHLMKNKILSHQHNKNRVCGNTTDCSDDRISDKESDFLPSKMILTLKKAGF
ncbi:MAG: hypothetical protein ACTJGV_16365, partial [Proteus vulgaris]